MPIRTPAMREDIHPAIQREVRVPRYFFDTHDGEHVQDHEGRECADFAAARLLALQSLPEIARWTVSNESDRHTATVLVRDGAGQLVYKTTLTLDGRRLGSESDHAIS